MLTATLAAIALCAYPAPGAEDLEVLHRDGLTRLDEIELPDRHRTITEQWTRWASTREYRVALEAEGRVLLVHPEVCSEDDLGRRRASTSRGGRIRERAGSVQDEFAHIARVFEHADRLFPSSPDVAWSAENVSGEAQPGELPALLMIGSAQAYAELLQFLASEHEYLRAWASTDSAKTGFVLGQPLAGAWLLAGDGLEEYSPRHELVNRLTRLLVMQRYGRLPRWLMEGLAWQAEQELLDSIYCFPSRDGFVFCTEHEDWGRSVRSAFKRSEGPVLIEELARIPASGGFDLDDCHRAWAFAEYMVQDHPGELAAFLVALAADRDANQRRDLGGGRWEIVPNYEPPVEKQAELLQEILGDETWEELGDFLRAGAR